MISMVTFAVISALASAPTPKLRAPRPQMSVQGPLDSQELVLKPPTAHHFNIQAPNTLANGNSVKTKPSSADESELRFSLANAKPGTLTLSVYVCDDAKTFCELHRFEAKWDGKKLADAKPAPESTETAHETVATTSLELDEHGFYNNQADAALAKAKAEGKPLMIDFYGIWCPPCNELNENVFSSSEFRESGSRFVKLKLDADSPGSWKLKSKYKVGGYPTVIFASSDGEEIRRVVGSRSRSDFVREMEKAWTSRKNPFPILKARADHGDVASAGQVGRIYLERTEYEPAIKYLAKDPASAEQLAEAKIGLAEQKKDPKLPDLLEDAITKFPKTPESVDRRVKLAGIYEEKKDADKQKILLAGAIQTAQDLIAHPERLAQHEVTPADLWGTIADAQETLGNDKDAKQAWKNAAAEYKKRIDSETERGLNIELAYCLWKSGDFGAATSVYEALEKAYPKEFTYWYAHGNMELERKKFEAALPLSKKAYEYSYGDNRLRAALQLAKVYKGLDKKEEAKTIINDTLKSAQIPTDESIRTHRYVKSLREFDKTLI